MGAGRTRSERPLVLLLIFLLQSLIFSRFVPYPPSSALVGKGDGTSARIGVLGLI